MRSAKKNTHATLNARTKSADAGPVTCDELHRDLANFLQLVSEAWSALLAEYGGVLYETTILPHPPNPPKGATYLAALVGFSGEGLRGNLSLYLPAELAGACHLSPTLEAPVSDVLLLDWVAELANQLAGRVKRKLLLRSDVRLSLGSPGAISGQSLLVGSRRLEHAPCLTLGTSHGQAFLLLEFDMDPELRVLAEDSPEATLPGAEGGMLML
ncbi:MAG: chemotaxis protein CheX [Nannocystaceae bacterium]